MSAMEWEDLGCRIYERANLNGEFWLRTGNVVDEYFDKYQLEADPLLLRDVAEALVTMLPARVEILAGVELGGVALATVCSQRCGLPTAFVRKRPDVYGTRRFTEGVRVAGCRVAVIKDVITSGEQVVRACEELRTEGAEIASVMCIIDRRTGGSTRLARAGLHLRSLFTMSEIQEAGGIAR